MKKRCASGATVMFWGLFFFFCFCFTATAEEDLLAHPSCPYCGMDRTKFAHSRVLITYSDHTTAGTCSLHCAAIDLSLHIDRNPVKIMVADYHTKNLIDAEKAFWVVGGSKMGVMTKRAKWAFESQNDADKFTSEFGGQTAAFSRSLKASFEDMYEDIAMIRAKRQKMNMKKGS